MVSRTSQVVFVLIAGTGVASADVSIKLEPGVAVPTTAPQSDIYDIGGGQSIKALFGLNRYLDIGPAASFLYLPAETDLAESGVAWGFGGGFRLKRPHDRRSSGISPWLDADALYMRTGDLGRFGFDAAVGVSFPVDDAKVFWVGPFVRYQHIVNTERMGYDTRDSKIVLAGLSIEFGTSVRRRHFTPRTEVVTVEPPPPPVTVTPATPPEISVAPVRECPVCVTPEPKVVYQNVIVTKDKLELKEKLFFEWNRAKVKPTSFSILDEVVLVLKDNPTINLRIEGHTDISGNADHNRKLSQRRAESVVKYLASKGIARRRLTAKGLGPTVPLETNDSADGRERNRRVEFVILLAVTEGSSK